MKIKVNTSLLEDFATAFNRHDCALLVSMITEDCVFETSFGSQSYGERYVGREILALTFPKIWHSFPDARWENLAHTVCGSRGFSEWTFRGTDINGKFIEVRGVDLFVFREGKICRKDTFRKDRHN
jgi:steroid delta-isomerase-like uncharacterized protein